MQSDGLVFIAGSRIPGAHVALIGTAAEALTMRRDGYALRDCLTILLPNGSVALALLFRIPFSGSLFENVLQYGEGGLCIDACRIDTGALKEGGRWPTNLLLVHAEACVPGTRKVQGTAPIPSGFDRLNEALSHQGYRPGTYQKGAPPPPRSRLDSDGLETIPAWTCVEGCPVPILDAQSGERTSGAGAVKRSTSAGYQGVAYGKESRPAGAEMLSYADTGGASRYYPQLASYEEALRWITTLLKGPDFWV